MKIIKAWDVQVWDGGGGNRHAFYILNEAQADLWKLKNPNDFIQEREFLFFETIEEYQNHQNGVIKKRALQKLTREERVALGFPAEV